jgi:hypothetical protein
MILTRNQKIGLFVSGLFVFGLSIVVIYFVFIAKDTSKPSVKPPVKPPVGSAGSETINKDIIIIATHPDPNDSSKTIQKKVVISDTDKQKYLDSMGGNTQNRKGCWTLDYGGWSGNLKSGWNCAVTSITLPADIKATAYTSDGRFPANWNNLCGDKDGNNPQREVAKISPGQTMEFGFGTVCGFLFERA